MKTIRYFSLWAMGFLVILSCTRTEKPSDAYGNFEAVEIMVSAMAPGALLSLNVDQGDQLYEGQLVGLIDTTEASIRVEQAKAQQQAIMARLLNVKAQREVHDQQLANLSRDYDRVASLYREGAATLKQKEDLEGAIALTAKQLQATLAQATSIEAEARAVGQQVMQLEEAKKKCFITNPSGGTVLSTYSRKGETVVYGKPLYKIADLSNMELKVYISGRQLAGFTIGQPVEVIIDQTAEQGNSSLKGEITWISASSEFTPKTIQTRDERVDLVYAMKVRVQNDGRLKIGMPGEIRILQP
jgi:HlyD family secretion protein